MAKVKPTTKTCKHCATEIPYEAKVCPNCRKKVKGGIIKWIILGIFILGILGSLLGGGDDSEDASPVENPKTETSQDAAVKEEETTEEKKIEYKEYNVTELFDDLNKNALKAEKKHQDEYVTIKGYLDTIDSDGKYISVGAGEDNYDYLFQSIQCDVQSDEQLDQIMEMSKNDKIIVKGQIDSIGEVLGYNLKIDTIKPGK